MEYHPFQQPAKLIEYCHQEGIAFQGYCPLAKGQALSNPTIIELAQKYGRTPAQICIRWSIQVMQLKNRFILHSEQYHKPQNSNHTRLVNSFFQNGVITIPKSTKKERVVENIEVSCEKHGNYC